jgi:antitoxin ParD1/3/4
VPGFRLSFLAGLNCQLLLIVSRWIEESCVPTRNINLTPKLENFVKARIRSGQYANASEVVRAGLRALEADEREDEARLEALRLALIAGEESGFVEGDALEQVRGSLRELPKASSA